jgi:hypothetical protein
MHFSWLMSDSDPEWATLQVFDALASLPFLNDLHLCCWSFSNPFLQPRRLPHLENLTFTRESWQDDDDIAPIPIARLINWSQPKLTTLIIADNGYHNDQNPLNLNDFLSETSKSSSFLNITHLRLKGLCNPGALPLFGSVTHVWSCCLVLVFWVYTDSLTLELLPPSSPTHLTFLYSYFPSDLQNHIRG